MNKPFKVSAVAAVGISLIALPVLAFSSTSYQQQALKYVNANCKAKVSDLMALRCYLYARTQELGQAVAGLQGDVADIKTTNATQDTSLGNLSSDLSALKSKVEQLEHDKPKGPKVVDANGAVLGTLVSTGAEGVGPIFNVYNPSLNRLLQLASATGGIVTTAYRQDILYDGPNCTGQGYMPFNADQYHIWHIEGTKFFRYLISSTPQQMHSLSILNTANQCNADDGTLRSSMAQVEQIQLPLSLPAPAPLDLDNE